MQLQKRALTESDLAVQSAFELPDRQMLLVTIVITNVLNDLSVDVRIRDVNVAVQVCAVINALNLGALGIVGADLDCELRQT